MPIKINRNWHPARPYGFDISAVAFCLFVGCLKCADPELQTLLRSDIVSTETPELFQCLH